MYSTIKDVVIFTLVFAGLYFQVFLLVSYFLWNGKTEQGEDDVPSGNLFEPIVAIMVPCFNEEKTVVKTISSLLGLEYPAEKLKIIAIDDGSRDGTWKELQKFAHHQSVILLQKKNEGSKFAALNFGLAYINQNISSEIIGCLDADSAVHPMALRESLREFTKPGVMAVIPSMVIDHPETFFQWMQKVEYEIATYAKQALSRLNTLYIAPGPFTLFRKKVFEVLGQYNEAHHVEDMEIALRMQMKGMRLSHAIDSLVYTRGPRTWGALLKQRVRWTYGFVMNVLDYRKEVFFNNNLGHVGVTIPMLFATLWLLVLAIPFIALGMIIPLVQMIQRFMTTHQVVPEIHLDPFYFNTSVMRILSIVMIATLIISFIIGKKYLLREKKLWSLDLLTTLIYPFFAAWWTLASAYDAIRKKKKAWR